MKDFFYNIALKIAESRKTKDEEKKASDKVERERQAAEWRLEELDINPTPKRIESIRKYYDRVRTKTLKFPERQIRYFNFI